MIPIPGGEASGEGVVDCFTLMPSGLTVSKKKIITECYIPI
jgi:hypothetical protein